ncbi:2589_t:CDS:2, partial [Cetraspora pellucida]
MSSKSTYISDDGFVVRDKQCLDCNEQKCICIRLNFEIPNNYITKQNAFITNGIPIFNDEGLRIDDIDLYQTYLVCKKNYGVFDGYCSDLLNYKETLEKMKKNRFSIDSVYTQLRAEIEVNENLLNDTKDSI